MHRIKFIARKEIYHILRDPRSLFIVFAMPIMMTFLYGYAINLDVENVVISVVDLDKSIESRELVDRFYSSAYFSKCQEELEFSDPEKVLRSGKCTGILLIRNGFSKALARGEKFELGMTVDGSDATLAAALQSYSNLVVNQFMMDRLPVGYKFPGVTISPQVLYNPDLKSSHFFVPGLVAVLLMMISALLTSVTIAREKETGTMEQLLTSPVRSHEIIIGKLIPYIVIAFLDGVIVVAFAQLVFGVPFVGSHLLLLGFGLVYVATALSIGILISSLVKTQQLAMMFAQLVTMLPSVMLSGFIFAIKNMPIVLQGISKIVPATYFIVIVRGIILKGATLNVLATQGIALVVVMLVMLTIAAKRFKMRIS